jgi:Zn-dependent protease with chaperone function
MDRGNLSQDRRSDMHWKNRDVWLRLEFVVGLIAVLVLIVANFISQFGE